MNNLFAITLADIGDVTISKITESDIADVAELIYATYQKEGIWLSYTKQQITEDISAAFTNQPAYRPTYFVAKLEGKIIGIAGYAESFMSSDAFELSFATILHTYQRKRLGTALITIRIQDILQKNSRPMIFTRTRAPKLFEKFNFQYIHKTTDTDGVTGSFDYMFCKGADIIFPTS